MPRCRPFPFRDLLGDLDRMDPPPATRAASRRRDRRRRLRQRQRAAAATKTRVGAAVLAVEPQSAAVTTPVASTGPAATPASRGRKRRRPRRRRGRNAGAAGVSDEPPAASPVPVPGMPLLILLRVPRRAICHSDRHHGCVTAMCCVLLGKKHHASFEAVVVLAVECSNSVATLMIKSEQNTFCGALSESKICI